MTFTDNCYLEGGAYPDQDILNALARPQGAKLDVGAYER
jgi:hypothetical protein